MQFVDIAGRWEFPIPGMAGYVHFSNLILYPGLPGTRTERVKELGAVLDPTGIFCTPMSPILSWWSEILLEFSPVQKACHMIEHHLAIGDIFTKNIWTVSCPGVICIYSMETLFWDCLYILITWAHVSFDGVLYTIYCSLHFQISHIFIQESPFNKKITQ
jgi:hypothetical protein